MLPEITDAGLAAVRAAAQEERRLWEAVKGRHPGHAKHDAGAWAAWARCEQELRRLTHEPKAARPRERAPIKTAWG